MIVGPSRDAPEEFEVAECADRLSGAFDEIHRAMVDNGGTELEAARALLDGVDHPQLAALAADAMVASWAPAVVRRAMLVLARMNLERERDSSIRRD